MSSFKATVKVVMVFLLSLAISALSVFPSKAFAAINDENGMAAEAYFGSETIVVPFFEYDYDTTIVYRYEERSIPVSFRISGLFGAQDYSLNVESDSLVLLKDYSNTNTEDKLGKDRWVSLDIEFYSANQVKNVDSINVHQIRISVSSTMYNTIPCTLTLFVIDSTDGVFVSYVDAELVTEYYYQRQYENGHINQEQLFGFADQKTMTKSYDDHEDALFSTKGVIATKIYINYTITPLNSGARIKVAGTLQWSDINGRKHPLKSVKVAIMDDDALFDQTLATVYTNSTGSFTSTVNNQTDALEHGGCDVYLSVYPVSSNITVKTNSNGNYYFTTPVTDNVSNTTTSMNQVLNPCNTANAFYIHQAGIVGAQHVNAMSGSAPSNVVFRYPYSDSGSNNFNGSYISIKSSSYYSWDVILHEYGHFIQKKFHIENNPGGTHIIDDNAIDTFYNNGSSLPTAKDKGTRLAWGEGWATYFGISSQVQQNVKSMNIPGAGDSSYDNLSGGWSVSLESYTNGKGEGHEMAVSCVLWDFADSATTTGSVSEAYDDVALGFKKVWDYTINSKAKVFSTFWNYAYNYASSTIKGKMGRILAAHRFSASNLRTNGVAAEACQLGPTTLPKLSWKKANGSVCCSDSYVLWIYSRSMAIIYAIPVSSSSYTLTTAQFNNLKNNYGDGFYWCVAATPASTPSTGPYYSQYIYCFFGLGPIKSINEYSLAM